MFGLFSFERIEIYYPKFFFENLKPKKKRKKIKRSDQRNKKNNLILFFIPSAVGPLILDIRFLRFRLYIYYFEFCF